MSMLDENVWVIRDKNGYFVNPNFKALFTGHATGFVFYTNEDIVRKKLDILGDGFYVEYVNLGDIPDGARVWV